jgi:hypothetical protein
LKSKPDYWRKIAISLIDPAIFGFSSRSVAYSATVRAAVQLSRFVNLEAIHCVVPKFVASFRMLVPWARSNCILSNSCAEKCRRAGLPTRLPARRAWAIPAFTRSRNISRSNSATAPNTANVNLPAGKVVSIFCRRDTRSTPSNRHSSAMVSKVWNRYRLHRPLRYDDGIHSHVAGRHEL